MFPGCCDNPPYRGISGLLDFTPRGGYLVGVFLDDTEPADPPPPSLDFTRSYDFSNLSPLLRQVFFIGDGRDASGEQQRFHVPAGATRLFLGQVDGQGEFFDNTGGFRASLTLGETDQADLTLNSRDSPDPVGVGDPLLYSTFVANNGPGGARNVTLTDTLPASVTFDSAHTTRGICDKPAGRTVVCHLGSFAPGGRAVVEILVTPNAVGRIKNTVEVESDTPDPVSSNNVASEKTTVSSGTATATFDAFDEGAGGTSFSDGGITFFGLDQRIPDPPGLGRFVVDRADQTLSGFDGFTPPNVLSFGGFVRGPAAAFGRSGEFRISTRGGGKEAGLELFESALLAETSLPSRRYAGMAMSWRPTR
jgi:uncharacterized repeat protein (TIGR01451 family)